MGSYKLARGWMSRLLGFLLCLSPRRRTPLLYLKGGPLLHRTYLEKDAPRRRPLFLPVGTPCDVGRRHLPCSSAPCRDRRPNIPTSWRTAPAPVRLAPSVRVNTRAIKYDVAVRLRLLCHARRPIMMGPRLAGRGEGTPRLIRRTVR